MVDNVFSFGGLFSWRMLQRLRGLLALVCLLGFVSAAGAQIATGKSVPAQEGEHERLSSATSTYRLSSGDVISIKVLNEEDLSKEKIRLSDAGTISHAVLGEIKVLGMTVGELERLVTQGLKGRYLVNPRVSVYVDEYRPFYINGMVANPGAYPFKPGLNVRVAAALAGGFKERASLSKIFVIRENDPSQRPQKVDLNTPINPGDIVTVEESFF